MAVGSVGERRLAAGRGCLRKSAAVAAAAAAAAQVAARVEKAGRRRLALVAPRKRGTQPVFLGGHDLVHPSLGGRSLP